VYDNTLDSPNANLVDVTYGSTTTHIVQSLAAWQASDPADLFGNQ
jgi:hypothetical protein